MPTLYVENVPEDIYQALRERAHNNGKSISAEVLTLLAENIPTPGELTRRRKIVDQMQKIRSRRPASAGPFSSTEQMQREDRAR